MVKETLQDVLDQSDQLDCVVVLGIYKDQSQLLRTSNASAEQKSFLFCFYQAWMTKWFKLVDD